MLILIKVFDDDKNLSHYAFYPDRKVRKTRLETISARAISQLFRLFTNGDL